MERLAPLLLSFLFYSVASFVVSQIVSAPKHLRVKDKVKEYRDFIGQHVSFLHSCLAVLFSSYILYSDGGVFYDIPMSQIHLLVLAVIDKQHSIGYFLYDTVYAEMFGIHGMMMRLHHVLGLVGGYFWLMSDQGGSVTCCKGHTDCALLAELSNPCMEARLIMKARLMEDTQIYKVVEIGFAASFLIMRIFAGGAVAFNIWASTIETVVCVPVCIVIGMGWYWCYVILAMMSKKLKGNRNLAAKALVAGVEVLKNHQIMLGIAIGIGCFVLPVYCGMVLKLGFIRFKLFGMQIA